MDLEKSMIYMIRNKETTDLEEERFRKQNEYIDFKRMKKIWIQKKNDVYRIRKKEK